jgi:hypothetical protein
MICGLLRSNAIACRYRKTDVGGAIGAVATVGPTEVIVYQRDLEAARKLLPQPVLPTSDALSLHDHGPPPRDHARCER